MREYGEHITDLQDKKALRVIETVRNVENIDYKIDSDYKPLIIKIVPSKKLTLLHTVTRNQKTGEINYVADTSGGWWDIDADIIGEEYIYPYKSETPYAMYLVPSDIQVGERVILNDLIEDYIGSYINGIPYRLKQCEAIWNGKGFDIDYDSVIIGIDITIG